MEQRGGGRGGHGGRVAARRRLFPPLRPASSPPGPPGLLSRLQRSWEEGRSPAGYVGRGVPTVTSRQRPLSHKDDEEVQPSP
ncbi:Os06g0253675 [Oryza sativa Japonica Group]|uniref:Os06g0253675 protein n=1 Tax=Oryza sativa subsp. japonica TaxID=39947 RepID=A0A0P0WV34_ORYSJ|nr:Os06g0253675 [Oryza sativa Japonica Group]